MNGNDERGIVPVLNSSHQTVKIDSLCIKLSIMKQKDDGSKCRHFSIRGYVAGMREKGSNNLLPFAELPPMDVPNFRYWRCQKCLQNNETANASNDTALISVYDHFVFPPVKSNPPQSFNGVTVLPFGEGTSGVKPVDDMNDDEIILAALGTDESQTSEEIIDKVKVCKEPTKCGTVDTNASKKESNELKDHENPQKTNISQPIESDQDNCQNGLPRRKARKVRLLKELLCGNSKIQQKKKGNSSSPLMAPISQFKRKMSHDRDHDQDDDHDRNHRHDHKKMKAFKGDAIAKTSVVEHSSTPEAREFGENNNKYEWNKHGTQRSSLLGKVNSDPMTAWRSIFNDVERSDNRAPPAYSVSKSRGTEPYSNFISPPKSDKKVNSRKITGNPIKSNFFVEDSRRMKDNGRSHAELALDLSLNYEAHPHVRSQPSILHQPASQDYNIKSSFFLGESSNFPPRIPSESNSKERLVHEKRLYTQLPYGSCSGHQKLDFSDPYKSNIGVKGYSEFTRPNNNHQRQEKMLSIGRSDEHEIIELMARNQYERNLCEPNNGIISGFHKHNMNEGMKLSHHEYLTMMRPPPSSDNVGPMRNPAGSLFQDQVPNFTMNQKKPLHGVWISDPRSQRHYDSHYHYASNGSNNKMPNSHLYNSSNMQAFEAFNKYNNGGNQKEQPGMQFGHTYARYPEKDKGKNMMDLDLNLVAPSVVEEHNNLEPNRMCSFDSSYSNEAIPAMQLLSLMDAGKSSQPFSLTGQPFIPKPKPKPISVCYSHCSSTVTEKTNPAVNPIGSSIFSVFQAGQNIKLTSSYGQQGYHKSQEEKSRGTPLGSVRCRPEDSYVFPLPWRANEGQNKVNGAFGPKFDSSRTEICTINQNPADFSIPGPHNMYMIGAEDLTYGGCSYKGNFTSENAFGPKSQRKVMKPTS